LEAKYFLAIQNKTPAGKFGAASIAMVGGLAVELLKESMDKFNSLPTEA